MDIAKGHDPRGGRRNQLQLLIALISRHYVPKLFARGSTCLSCSDIKGRVIRRDQLGVHQNSRPAGLVSLYALLQQLNPEEIVEPRFGLEAAVLGRADAHAVST